MPCRVKQAVGKVSVFASPGWDRGQLTLKNFEVLQIRILGIDVELDSRHWDIKVDTVEDLAERRTVWLACQHHPGVNKAGHDAGRWYFSLPSSALLDLGDI